MPKPTPGEWRFCLDFVRLNDATPEMEDWPIPNIRNMIDRIGRKKAKYFGVMDMTSGYHQAPLSKSAQVFTAFITFMEVFQWLRVVKRCRCLFSESDSDSCISRHTIYFM